MSKLYFKNDNERCYTKSYLLKEMKDLNCETMPVFEAKREIGSNYFYCQEFDDLGEKGQGCGKMCQSYSPRNKISGICNHSRSVYEQTDKMVILTNKFYQDYSN